MAWVALTAGLVVPAVVPAAAAAALPASQGPVWTPSPAVPSPAFQAQQSGQRVEIPSDRTQTSSTYVTPDGNYQTVVSPGSINYKDAQGAWQPIDDTLIADPTTGYSVANKANGYRAEFPSALGSAPVKVSIGAAWVAFSLNGATATPATSTGSTATYTNALAGVSVNYQAEADSVKETLVLASAATPASYGFSVTASTGVSLAADGNQITLSQAGVSIGILQAPTMTDAHGVSGPVSMSLAANATGWTVTVTPDAGWLAATGRAFPVQVDPTVTVSPSSVCWVDSFSPTIHECSGGSSLIVGSVLQGGVPPLYPVHGLVNFALPSTIPNDAVVTSAGLTANVNSAYGTNTIDVRRVTQAWNVTQTTWNLASTSTNWTTAGGTYDTTTAKYTGPTYTSGSISATGTATWEPTQLVQDWLNYQGTSVTGVNNLGVLLRQTNEGNQGDYGLDTFMMTINWAYRWGPGGSIHLNNQSINDKATLGVQVADDNAVLSNNDLSIAGTGENLTVNRYYNSAGLTGGSAWTFSVGPDVKVKADASGTILAKEAGGAQVVYNPSATVTGQCVYAGTVYSSYYITPPGADATLCALSPGYELTTNSSQGSLVFGKTSGSGTSLSQQIDRNGDTITYNYNTSNQVTSMTDTQGRTFNVTEDPTTGKINQITGPVGATGAQFRTWGYSWASNGQLNYYTDPTGQVTHYSYDTNGNLSEILSPGVYVSGTLTATETDIAQTAGGQVTSVTRKDPSCPSGSCTTTYNTVAAPQPVTSGANRCASYRWSGGANTDPTTMIGCGTVTDPDSHQTSYGWDIYDQVVKTVDGLNQVSHGTYNGDNQSTDSYDNSGNHATATFDPAVPSTNNQLTGSAPISASGQTAAMSDGVYATPSTPAVMGPAGSTVPGYQYLASTGTDANNNCGTSVYDSNGNPTTQWSGLTATGTGGTRTCTPPTGAPGTSQIKTVKTYTGDSGSTGCTGVNGQLCTSTNGNGGITTYAYNSVGQLLTVTPPSPQSPTTYTYDANGRVATVTDGAGRVTTTTYDADDRVVVTNINAIADPSCTTAADCVKTTYDPNGNVTSQIDGSGTTTKKLNQLNQLSAEYLPAATTTWTCGTVTDAGLHYTYDPAGNLASYCDQGGTVTYVYDADNHNTGVADPGGNCTPGSVVQPCTTFAYSPTGQRTGVTYPTSTGVTTAIGYDGASNETSIVTSKSGTAFINLTYTYTKAGSSTTDTGLRQTAVDHISGVTTTYSYTPQVQLQCAGTAGACSTAGYQYTYDLDGNMTKQTVNGTLTSYTYNAADESTTGSATYNGAGDQTATNAGTTLAYNSFAQTKTIGANSYAYTGANQNGLVTAAGTGIQTSSLLGITAITTSGVTTNITRDSTGNLVTIRNGGASYYYLFDAQHSVIGLMNSTGAEINSPNPTYSYDPYGNRLNTPAAGIATTNPFRYDSGYLTPNGLYHYGARYYNPSVGAWTQLDPSGQSAGYVYAGDDPVNNADPSGTVPVAVYGGGGEKFNIPITFVELDPDTPIFNLEVQVNVSTPDGPYVEYLDILIVPEPDGTGLYATSFEVDPDGPDNRVTFVIVQDYPGLVPGIAEPAGGDDGEIPGPI